MNLSDFDFELPAERIAQHPLERRDDSRLMSLDLESDRLIDGPFDDLLERLAPGDLLVLNDTRVVPARVRGRKSSGGELELLLLERDGAGDGSHRWRCLMQVSRPPRPGAVLSLEGGAEASVVRRDAEAWILDLRLPAAGWQRWIEQVGQVPLPPYISRPGGPEDRDRYQTVFARHPGAVAAPTAGLHFTRELLERIRQRGVEIGYLTLHVGPGTFSPVRAERVEDHRMHHERFVVGEELGLAVERTRRRQGRVVAVGTTVVRVLEYRALDRGRLQVGSGRCDLFIYPGFRFRMIDAVVTNFHLPRSTLLMLVAAFAGRQRILSAYASAIERGFRFYSYGDAMYIGSFK